MKDKAIRRFMLTSISRSMYYGVVHVLGESLIMATRDSSNAIVYIKEDLDRAKGALIKKGIPYLEIEIGEEQLIKLLDWNLNEELSYKEKPNKKDTITIQEEGQETVPDMQEDRLL